MKKRKAIEVGEEAIVMNKELALTGVKINRQYIVDTMTYAENKYVGELVPLPLVLVKYLTASELRVFVLILGKLTNQASFYVRREYIAQELGVSVATVSHILTSLENMELISQERCGMKVVRTINFKTLQKLTDILTDRLPGAEAAFRKEMGDGNINRPTPTAMSVLDLQYTEQPEEEQENYD